MQAAVLLVLVLVTSRAQGRFLNTEHPIDALLTDARRRKLEDTNDASGAAFVSDAAFLAGTTVGAVAILAIIVSLGVCICYLKRRKESLEAKEVSLRHVQVGLVSPRRHSSDGRISFVRSSVREDASLCAIEHLELEKIELGASLGRGAFGKVYRGEFAGIPLAIKVFEHDGTVLRNGDEPLETYLSRNTDHANVVKTFVNETRRCQSFAATASVNSILKSPLFVPSASSTEPGGSSSSKGSDDEFSYIARAMGTVDSEDSYRTWIVMEYCDLGSLDQAIRGRVFFVDGQILEPKIRFMLRTAYDIASAMDYLHDQCIVHGDLKSQNVLLKRCGSDERGFTCKVGDFGLSRVIINKTHIDTFTHGTVSHSAPELFKEGLLTPAADVYSYGILLWELFTGHKAYTGMTHNGIIIAVTRGCRPAVPHHCPFRLAQLVQDCWADSYSNRPTFKTILKRLGLMLQECTSLTAASFDWGSYLSLPETEKQTLNDEDICNKDLIPCRTSLNSRERAMDECSRSGKRIGTLPISSMESSSSQSRPVRIPIHDVACLSDPEEDALTTGTSPPLARPPGSLPPSIE